MKIYYLFSLQFIFFNLFNTYEVYYVKRFEATLTNQEKELLFIDKPLDNSNLNNPESEYGFTKVNKENSLSNKSKQKSINKHGSFSKLILGLEDSLSNSKGSEIKNEKSSESVNSLPFYSINLSKKNVRENESISNKNESNLKIQHDTSLYSKKKKNINFFAKLLYIFSIYSNNLDFSAIVSLVDFMGDYICEGKIDFNKNQYSCSYITDRLFKIKNDSREIVHLKTIPLLYFFEESEGIFLFATINELVKDTNECKEIITKYSNETEYIKEIYQPFISTSSDMKKVSRINNFQRKFANKIYVYTFKDKLMDLNLNDCTIDIVNDLLAKDTSITERERRKRKLK